MFIFRRAPDASKSLSLLSVASLSSAQNVGSPWQPISLTTTSLLVRVADVCLSVSIFGHIVNSISCCANLVKFGPNRLVGVGICVMFLIFKLKKPTSRIGLIDWRR